jgi:hypothetical protein
LPDDWCSKANRRRRQIIDGTAISRKLRLAGDSK